MRHKIINPVNQPAIHVFDDVFSLNFRSRVFKFGYHSQFRLGWSDSISPEHRATNDYFHSAYSEEDIKNLGILDQLAGTAVMDVVGDRLLTGGVLNCGVSSDHYYVHCHQQSCVVLYYVNLHWQDGFHGETQFYSEDRTEITWTSPYTPGRVIVFDGRTPHSIRSQSSAAPKHRFTLALLYQ